MDTTAPDDTAHKDAPPDEHGAGEEDEDDSGEEEYIKVPPTEAAMRHPIYDYSTLEGPDRPTLCMKCRQYVPLRLKDTHECVLPHYLRVTFPLNPEVCFSVYVLLLLLFHRKTMIVHWYLCFWYVWLSTIRFTFMI